MELPDLARYVVVGAGIHGLSTAWHLAQELVARGRGSGAAGLAHCLKQFEGKSALFSPEPSGGIGCFTPDSFPVFDVFDVFGDNVYVIADSNHGYKMIGVGALVAKELMGAPQPLLEPFRFSRYAEGNVHPVSHSPFPWS